MKILYSIAFLLFFLTSCVDKRTYVLSPKANYEITRAEHLLIIKRNDVEQADTFTLKDGEFFDSEGHLILSVKRKMINRDTLPEGIYPILITKIHKVSKSEIDQKLQHPHKNVFVTEFSEPVCSIKDSRHIVLAYYYDSDYNILKIISTTSTSFICK